MRNSSNNRNRKRKCANCDKAGIGIMEKRITRVYGKSRNTLAIENVPVIVCPHCGTSHLEAKTLHELERINLHRKSFAKQKSLDIADFALWNNTTMLRRRTDSSRRGD